MDYTVRGVTESDMTKQLSLSVFFPYWKISQGVAFNY